MFLRVVFLVCSLFLSGKILAADAILQMPEFFELVSINGSPVGGNLLQRARSFSLTPGDTVIELRYNDIQQADIGDSHTNFRSEAFALRFKYGLQPRRAGRSARRHPFAATQYAHSQHWRASGVGLVRSSAVRIAWRFAPIRVEGRVVLRQFHVRSGAALLRRKKTLLSPEKA